MDKIEVGNITFGSDKIVVIADIGLCHNGSLDIAKTLIDISVVAGVDIVKFQKRDVPSLAIKAVLDAEDNRFPAFGSKYGEIRKYLEFTEDEYKELIEYSEKKGILFSCTPFDIKSVDFLEKLDLKIYKLASHSLTNLPLLEYISKKGKPVILSTGMCTWEEIDCAVKIFDDNKCPLMLLHCVSSYPTKFDEANLPMIDELKSRYNKITGFSSHEKGILPSICAAAKGAKIIERHITLDHDLEGFDHKIAVDPYEVRELVVKIRDIEKMLIKTNKTITENEMVTRNKYRVSIVSNESIKKGTVITKDMITFKNPGTGIQPKDMDKIINKKAAVDIPVDILINKNMVE